MIKANELRRGSYIIVDTGFALPAPHQIKAKDLYDLSEGRITIASLEPIPLTPELMDKCGFEKSDTGYHSRRIDEYIWLHIYDDGCYGFWSDSVENEANFTVMSQDNRMKYLHQLQNLVHALSGEELSVNL